MFEVMIDVAGLVVRVDQCVVVSVVVLDQVGQSLPFAPLVQVQ